MNTNVCLHLLAGAVLCFAFASPLSAATTSLQLTIAAGEHDRRDAPVKVVVHLPQEFAQAKTAELSGAGLGPVIGQLSELGLLAQAEEPRDGRVARELHFHLPELAAGETRALTAKISSRAPLASESFEWTDSAGRYAELSFAGRPVLRYMYEALDESSAERRQETYKVYHHVYDPQGERFVTKGPGGRFPHHRGLFYGFNRISYNDGQKRADTWHCNNGESQSHEGFLASEAGPVMGRHLATVGWRGRDGEIFATEQRELTAYNTSDGILLQFASRLQSEVGKVELDGDPQHAGFQFRAAQEVADQTAKLTYYLRPDGKDKPGSFRNWPGAKDHVNLPWNAMSFVVQGERYTCCYLDHPENPKPARFSERDYGRFGSYFEYELDENQPLDLVYRIWLQEGEMTVGQAAAHSNNFVEPVSSEEPQ